MNEDEPAITEEGSTLEKEMSMHRRLNVLNSIMSFMSWNFVFRNQHWGLRTINGRNVGGSWLGLG